VFNNYGNKSNENLIISHGFAIFNNIHDSYLLEVRVGVQVQREKEEGGCKGEVVEPEVTSVGEFFF
jgi:hypothetical protein